MSFLCSSLIAMLAASQEVGKEALSKDVVEQMVSLSSLLRKKTTLQKRDILEGLRQLYRFAGLSRHSLSAAQQQELFDKAMPLALMSAASPNPRMSALGTALLAMLSTLPCARGHSDIQLTPLLCVCCHIVCTSGH